jgi:hypothetical protein
MNPTRSRAPIARSPPLRRGGTGVVVVKSGMANRILLVVIVGLVGVLAAGCKKKQAEEPKPDEPAKLDTSGTNPGDVDPGPANASASTAGSAASHRDEPEPLPTDGVHVADVKGYGGKVREDFPGLYDKAIAHLSEIETDRLFVFVTRDCPTLDCKTIEDSKGSVEKLAEKTCSKGFALILDARFKGGAQPGEHVTRVVLQDLRKDQSFEFLESAAVAPITITELSDKVVAGTIRFKNDHGSVMGTFNATMCKPPKR